MGHSAKVGRSLPPKIMGILRVISTGGAQAVPDIASLTGLTEPVVHRWTRRLADWRLLEPPRVLPDRAGLVLRLADDGTPATASGFPPERFGRTPGRVRVGVLHGNRVVFVELRMATAWAPTERLTAAGTRSAETTAMGHALLAFRSDKGAHSPVAQRQPADVMSNEKLALALAVALILSGVAITPRRTSAGGYRVAVPVLGGAGTAVVAIELPVPDLGDGFPPLLDALIAASRSTAHRLALLDPGALDD